MPSACHPTSLPDFLGPAELLLGLRSPWALGGVSFLCGYPPDFSVPRSPDFGQPWWGEDWEDSPQEALTDSCRCCVG